MKIRLAEILDAMRPTQYVVLKDINGAVMGGGRCHELMRDMYVSWWVVRVDDDNSVTISKEETDCEYISHDIGGEPRILDATINREKPKYILAIGATEDDLTDKELCLLHYGVLPKTNYHRVLQLPVREMAGLIELFAGHSCGCDYCLVNDRCEYYTEYTSGEFKYDEWCFSENRSGFCKWLEEPYSPKMFDKARKHMLEYGPFPDGRHFTERYYRNLEGSE